MSRAWGGSSTPTSTTSLYVEQVTEWARRYAEHVEVGIHTVADLEAEVVRRPPTKLVLVTSPADADAVLAGLQERWRGRLYVVRSQPEYIEFADASVSKSGALAWLCARLGVAREQVVTLGDGMNDVDMLAWAGLGVAVAEADEPVRAAADLVVPRAGIPGLLRELAHGRTRAHRSEGGAWRGGAAFEGPRCWWDSTGLCPPDGTRDHCFDCDGAQKEYDERAARSRRTTRAAVKKCCAAAGLEPGPLSRSGRPR